MAQAVSRWPLNAKARVRAAVSPCRIYGRKSGNKTGVSWTSSVFPCQCNSTVPLHTHITYGRWTTDLLMAAVQRQSHPRHDQQEVTKHTPNFLAWVKKQFRSQNTSQNQTAKQGSTWLTYWLNGIHTWTVKQTGTTVSVTSDRFQAHTIQFILPQQISLWFFATLPRLYHHSS
jgi:hypothetical protein